MEGCNPNHCPIVREQAETAIKQELKLKALWDFCDREIKEIYDEGVQEEIFQQGYLIALRKLQYEISGRCTTISKFVNEQTIC